MNDLLREHIGEIALLIYILYPLLKRWYDRRKKARKQTGGEAKDKSSAPTRAEPRQTTPRRPSAEPSVYRPEPPRPIEPRPQTADLLVAARAETNRLEREALRLLEQSTANRRLARVAPALREDLLRRLAAIRRSLEGSPTLSTLVQETTALRGLDELLSYLARIMRQRIVATTSVFGRADRMIDDLYGPLLHFCNAQNLGLQTSEPVAVSGHWDRAVAPRFASTHVAPIRLPDDFEDDVGQWPGLAAEVARDFYYSFEHLERDLRDRLNLPDQVKLPSSDGEVDARWLMQLFGPWLPETFVDVMGTLMLGPAYTEWLRNRHRDPASPQRTGAVYQNGALIDERPPARLRIYGSVRVLHHLGRHQEADALWERWEAEHPDIRLYFLPLGGRWAGLADETLHSLADSLIDSLVLRPWPELEGFQLMNIPGLAYLHAEHFEVERLTEALAKGLAVEADARWIIAAAVLAVAAQPALYEIIFDAAWRSIEPLETQTPQTQRAASRALRSETIGRALKDSTRSPAAIQQAIVLGAALGPRRHGTGRHSTALRRGRSR
ncbi:MAG: hypothetical protein PVH76_02685 [Myxococcales bacterium]|jgi:hypothetical protein